MLSWEQADFIIGQSAIEPKKPDLLTIGRAFPGLSDKEASSLYIKAAEKTDRKQEKYKEIYQKKFGKVIQTCDQYVKDRLFRLPDFADVRAGYDCIRLWEMICSVAVDDGTELDLAERKFRASIKFTGVAGFSDESVDA